ncbi:hypothetical protein BLS_005001 [Venturia inaequalis]|uniref:Uncharacterized protein n=1 Tax=Venturia inaequalis TaxID=5025 RepID=A0A8H3UIT8_VENIN|nr:hypothetical protein BLS_005001 [Venturia inaequalis]
MANGNQNFDFPPASDSNLHLGSLTDRFQDLRQHLNPDQGESSNSLRQQRPHPHPSQIHSSRYRSGRRGTHQNTYNHLPPVAVLGTSRSPSSSPAAYSPPSARPGRGRHSSSWRRRVRREMQDGTETLEDLIRDRPARLDQLHWQLNGVCYLVREVDHGWLTLADTESALRASDESAPRLHRSKRRKITDDTSERNVPAFKYGYHGQTIPGRLNMEIVRCDGGEWDPARDSIAVSRETHRAENVLKDDKSVYCTRHPECNLLLRHRDESIFHLDSLTIRAPETGYTAPSLQQGLVFVGMTPESLVKGSAAYHIRYEDSSSHTRSPSPSSGSESIPLVEALHDRAVWDASRERMRYRDHELDFPGAGYSAAGQAETTRRADFLRRYPRRTGIREHTRSRWSTRNEEHTQNSSNLDYCDWPPLEPVASNGLARAPTPPPFTVIAESDDGSDDGSIRTGYLPPMVLRDDGSDEYRDTIRGLHYGIPRPARRTSPGRIEPRSNFVTEGEGESETGNVLQPSASFFMGEQRSRITIKFEPPV